MKIFDFIFFSDTYQCYIYYQPSYTHLYVRYFNMKSKQFLYCNRFKKYNSKLDNLLTNLFCKKGYY